MMPARPPETDDTLKRERAGTYRTRDGRFTIESSSSGWLLLDAEQTDGLGLPLARGPFATLDAAKAAIGPARSGPAPISDVGRRPPGRKAPAKRTTGRRADAEDAHADADGAGERDTEDVKGDQEAKHATRGAKVAPRAAKRPGARAGQVRKSPPAVRRDAVVIREIRVVDGDALRALWAEAGFGSLGDDDRSLARLARRNPGLVMVASAGGRVVGSALGAWDGRRGWVYHVAVSPSHRRQGIATRLVGQIEEGLASLGCPKVNVVLRDASDGGAELWQRLGYATRAARLLGKELGAG
jgi:ribosomal protein S18 acetylase RimI-like enzyme